jgi:DNA-binding CsgD family transcriptional regulator
MALKAMRRSTGAGFGRRERSLARAGTGRQAERAVQRAQAKRQQPGAERRAGRGRLPLRERRHPPGGREAGFPFFRRRKEVRRVVMEKARLTRREAEVLRMLAGGRTYAQAAAQLGMSANTVGSHVKSAYRKLDVHSAAAAVMRAIELRLLEVIM